MKKCLILANGRPPGKRTIRYLMDIGYTDFICADGGANKAYQMKLVPKFIIGDFDSIRKKVLEHYNNISRIIKIASQDNTDVEKCLEFVIQNNYSAAVLTGVTGDRLDHTLCNLGLAVKYFRRINIMIVAENSILLPLTGIHEFSTVPGETVSVYGLDKTTTVRSAGLKYQLENTTLPFGEKESTSNIALNDRITLDIKGGIIFMIRDYNTVKNNDFILTD